MKNIFALLLLVSSGVFAFPSLNDSVTYKGKRTAKDSVFEFTKKVTLVAYNREQNSYTLRAETSSDKNEVQMTEELVLSDQLKSSALMEILMDNCLDVGGERASMKINEQEVDTCRMKEDRTEIWLANVPFGIAKQIEVLEDGTIVELELISFSTTPQ